MFNTDIVHTFLKFEDSFSGAILNKITTVSGLTFKKLSEKIDVEYYNQYDKKSSIHYNWILKEVRQALPSDYKQN